MMSNLNQKPRPVAVIMKAATRVKHKPAKIMPIAMMIIRLKRNLVVQKVLGQINFSQMVNQEVRFHRTCHDSRVQHPSRHRTTLVMGPVKIVDRQEEVRLTSKGL